MESKDEHSARQPEEERVLEPDVHSYRIGAQNNELTPIREAAHAQSAQKTEHADSRRDIR